MNQIFSNNQSSTPNKSNKDNTMKLYNNIIDIPSFLDKFKTSLFKVSQEYELELIGLISSNIGNNYFNFIFVPNENYSDDNKILIIQRLNDNLGLFKSKINNIDCITKCDYIVTSTLPMFITIGFKTNFNLYL